ncbi:unnamed protein product [Pleuronectes platessa]|uniref:Uncharacterized protein n=1 Tax=Pleuronectes platessa TaxID=8262 RepID=A0A9N7Z169_PLEPL|nr:unnamed protein product [Pleuronectes platessa]
MESESRPTCRLTGGTELWSLTEAPGPRTETLSESDSGVCVSSELIRPRWHRDKEPGVVVTQRDGSRSQDLMYFQSLSFKSSFSRATQYIQSSPHMEEVRGHSTLVMSSYKMMF